MTKHSQFLRWLLICKVQAYFLVLLRIGSATTAVNHIWSQMTHLWDNTPELLEGMGVKIQPENL
jgi:hypothetical protein